jgi:antitoxin ParD1/3/4
MTITLRPDQEQLLLDIMRTGSYENAEEAIGSALEILHSQNEWLSENSSLVDAKIREGIAQLDRGEGIPETELAAHLDRLKAQQE